MRMVELFHLTIGLVHESRKADGIIYHLYSWEN